MKPMLMILLFAAIIFAAQYGQLAALGPKKMSAMRHRETLSQ